MITSANNEQIKNIIQLQNKAKSRRNTKTFIIEGLKIFNEIPKERLVMTYLSETFAEDQNLNFLEGINYDIICDKIFKNISDTIAPQGILAVVKQHEYSLEEILYNEKKCFFLLENIQDPGNLGTILRTGEGAGISAIIMSKNTVDIYNPKVIRSTMGSIFRVPFVYVEDLSDAVDHLKESGIMIYAAHLNGEQYYYDAVYTKPSAFLIGNESSGLSDELTSQADCLIKIKMFGQVESLNAAIASSLLMYEVLRQNNKSV